MKRLFMVLAISAILPLGLALAADKPDCSAQEAALVEAQARAKARADFINCKEMKGKEKAKCEKVVTPLAKKDAKAEREKVAGAKKAVGCCKNPKKKGCE
jgi:hypothetical protein